jgi:uncharacterized protein YbbC (DUF1343 family)
MSVVLGLERLLDGPDRRLIDGARIGLVSNPASVDRDLVHASDRLFGTGDWTLTTLFGPQHGFHSDLQENMIESPHARDAKRRLPVYSLYSETREPTAEMLAGVEVLVVDLQDVGTRIYTYIYTLANCLRAARTTASASSSAIARTRSAARPSKGWRSTRRMRRLSGSFRSRCGTG